VQVKGFPIIALCVLLASCATSAHQVASGSTASDTVVLPAGPSAQTAKAEAAVLPPAKAQPPKAAEVVPHNLSDSQLMELALKQVPSSVYPVMNGSKPVALVADLPGSGSRNVILLAVATENADQAQVSVLSELSRLFIRGLSVPTFYIEIYHQHQGSVSFAESISLGSQPVLEGIRTLQLRKAADSPLAVIASFRGREGEVQEWTIFSADSHRSRFTTRETPNTHTVVRDIDGNGTLDILTFHLGMEAGVGYETFISWYRFESGAFRLYRSTNVVRNLQSFLSAVRQDIIAGNWERFLRTVAPPQKLSLLVGEGYSTQAIVRMVFSPASAGVSGNVEPKFNYFTPERAIQDIVFPQIVESPFPDPDRSLSVTMTARIVCCNGENHFYSMQLSMAENPFGPQEFSLGLNANGQGQ